MLRQDISRNAKYDVVLSLIKCPHELKINFIHVKLIALIALQHNIIYSFFCLRLSNSLKLLQVQYHQNPQTNLLGEASLIKIFVSTITI